MEAVIEASELSKSFGDRLVLDEVSFRVGTGERIAILGLNGAGKTTLIRCAMGLLSYGGSVRIGGLEVGDNGKRARGLIGYVPQRPPLFGMGLGAMVELFATIRGTPRDSVVRRLADLGLALEESADTPVRALSGGMLQKILLAIALASDPPVLMLDEPTANLDPRARREFLRSLDAVGANRTVLLASHRLEEVETLARRVWILHDGRLVFDGSLDALRARAGAEGRLWIRTTAGHRDQVRAELADRVGHGAVVANGTRVGVRVPAEVRADEICRLRAAGIPVEDFWVETPSLEEIVATFFGGEL